MLFRWRKRYSFTLVIATAFTVFIVAAFWHRVFYSVHSGEVGVLYRFFRGTNTERTYGEGLTILFPWNKLYIYDVREQEKSEDVEVMSYNGLSIRVSFSFRFQPDPDRVGELHKKIGPEYVDKLVRPLLVATVREVIGNYRPEELFTTHSATLQDEIRQIAQREIEAYHVSINQILVKAVKLPESVEKAIQEKLVLQQVAEGYDFRLVSEERERQRKLIESDGIRQFHENVAKGLSGPILTYLNIQAMQQLALSDNAKVVVLGGKGGDGLMLPLMVDDLNKAPTKSRHLATAGKGGDVEGPVDGTPAVDGAVPDQPAAQPGTPEPATGQPEPPANQERAGARHPPPAPETPGVRGPLLPQKPPEAGSSGAAGRPAPRAQPPRPRQAPPADDPR
jgi:regulator of protease activity HflC (stomatin/prohibitin superfamily)